MSEKRHVRTAARRAALQVLYSSELVGTPVAQIIEQGSFLEDGEKLGDYAMELARGAAFNQGEIDAYLKEASENWSLDRMPVVDRCLLRMAVYEMIYVDMVPVSVTINEAVELAKDFGGEDDSSRFVNGVLGKIALTLEGDKPEEQADAEETPAEAEAVAVEGQDVE